MPPPVEHVLGTNRQLFIMPPPVEHVLGTNWQLTVHYAATSTARIGD